MAISTAMRSLDVLNLTGPQAMAAAEALLRRQKQDDILISAFIRKNAVVSSRLRRDDGSRSSPLSKLPMGATSRVRPSSAGSRPLPRIDEGPEVQSPVHSPPRSQRKLIWGTTEDDDDVALLRALTPPSQACRGRENAEDDAALERALTPPKNTPCTPCTPPERTNSSTAAVAKLLADSPPRAPKRSASPRPASPKQQPIGSCDVPSWPTLAQGTVEMLRRKCSAVCVEIAAGGQGVGDALHKLRMPMGVAVAPGGAIVIADTGNSRVVRWVRGACEGQVIIRGSRSGPDLFEPVGVATYASGETAVTASGCVELWSRRSALGDGREVHSGKWPTGIAIESDGGLLYADTLNHSVVRCTLTRNSVQTELVNGSSGFGSGDLVRSTARDFSTKLQRPFGIAVSVNGDVLVADSGNHRVVRWPRACVGRRDACLAAGGNGRGSRCDQLNYPKGVVADLSGAVLVADTFNHRVMRWSPGASRGEVIVGGNGCGYALDQLHRPIGLAFDGEGGLLIADTGNHRVLRCRLLPGHAQSAYAAILAPDLPGYSDSSAFRGSVEEEPWAKNILNMIKESFHPSRSGMQVEDIFQSLDRSRPMGDDLSLDEFSKIVRAYCPSLSARSVRHLFALVNRSGSGYISCYEFKKRFG